MGKWKCLNHLGILKLPSDPQEGSEPVINMTLTDFITGSGLQFQTLVSC